jgi:glycosyltransferase involved in cell wall biosynthesis
MSKVSILIPARGESFENLSRTVKSIYDNATGDFEIIVGYDGTKPHNLRGFEDSRLSIIAFPNTVGIKTNINAMAAMATGKYIYKSDAHCSFSPGFDVTLQERMEDDWLVMPRFKIIKEDWTIQERNGEEEYYDYFYLCCPFTDPKGFRFKAGGHWKERTCDRAGIMIDETPQIHGSGWFMTKDRYFELGGFPNIDPYGHAQEPIWLALKNQLMGGKCMVNKLCWYAHLHQQGNKRGYHMDRAQENKSYDIAAKTFMSDPRMFDWLEKNMPMPTWTENWRELLTNYQKNGI